MGLRDLLFRYAPPRPFVVSSPGGTHARVALEAELRARGLRQADAPAETGFLVVCGEPGPALAEAVETVWRDMPGPRARVDLHGPDVGAVLDEAAGRLSDVVLQHADAMVRLEAGPWRPAGASEGPGSRAGDGSHEAHGSHAGMQHSGMGHSHSHHMGVVDGLAMAERADDRDGLRLDVLHVPLGPVLAGWPAGLRVDLTLQGDIVQGAEGVALETADASYWDGRWAARRFDGLARLLYVAGWDAAAGRAAVLRDAVLAGVSRDEIEPRIAAFCRRVGRSRALRWMTRGVGVLGSEAAERRGLPVWCIGDVKDRLDAWLAEVRADDWTGSVSSPVSSAGILGVLPSLLEGSELAQARLIVASLDPDLAHG